MEYFLMEQDKRYVQAPILQNLFNILDKRMLNEAQHMYVPELVSVFVKTNPKMQYIDFLDRQVTLVSQDLKKILKLYEPKMPFKSLALIDQEEEICQVYDLPILQEVDCVHEESLFNLDRSVIKHLVLKQERIPDQSMFKLGGVNGNFVIARLDLVESILRRNMKGMTFKPVLCK